MGKFVKCGIVGLPNVGKSTLFNLLTNSEQAKSENYPFCTIDPNKAIVNYIDERVDELSKINQSQKNIYSALEIIDIAGLVEGASNGEGLGNQFLSHIREVEAIIHVVRCFPDEDVVHVADKVDPVDDLEIIQTELRLADKETVEKMKKKQAKNSIMLAKLENVEKVLNKGENPYEDVDLPLLSSKPFIVLGNGCQNIYTDKIQSYCEKNSLVFLHFDFNDKDLSQMNKLFSLIFKLLHVIFYFTSGKQETRSWAILEGTNAKEAAREIHTDICERFIKAEVYNFRELGTKYRTRQEGAEYIVKDGDIILFKHW